MIYILADGFLEATRCAKEFGLARREWRCLFDERQFIGIKTVSIWLWGKWWQNHSSTLLHRRFCQIEHPRFIVTQKSQPEVPYKELKQKHY